MPGTNAKIARDPTEGMQFKLSTGRQSIGTGSATPIGLADSASAALPVANNRGLFFANTYPATDTVVSPSLNGIDLTLYIRRPSAPSEFSWRVAGPQTELFLQSKSDAAGLNYRSHNPGGSYYPLLIQVDPFPHDSARPVAGQPYTPGTKVNTHLTVSGDQLTIRVDHSARKLTYPLLIPIAWQSALAP
jgi:hypothetical protein